MCSPARPDPPAADAGAPPPAPFPWFRDLRGRQWLVRVNHETAKAVHEATRIDLARLAFAPGGWGYVQLAALAMNPARLVAVLWVLCNRQASSLRLTEGDFAAAVGGFDAVTDPEHDPAGAHARAVMFGHAGAALIRAVALSCPGSPLAAMLATRKP